MPYRTEEIGKVLEGHTGDPPFHRLFRETGERLLFTLSMAEELNEGPSFERVKELNIHCQAPLLQGAYEKTFADPAMAVKLLGEEKGRFASVLAHRVYTLFRAAFSRNSARLQEVADQWLEAAMAGEEEFVATLTEAFRRVSADVYREKATQGFNPGGTPWTGIAEKASGDDLSYLYAYGERITDNDLKTAEFIFSMPLKDLQLLAETMVDAYIEGFREDSKDITTKSTVGLIIQAGYERIVPLLVEGFSKHGLRAFVITVQGTKLNRQMDYDHRFDYALYIDEGRVNRQLMAMEKAYQEHKGLMEAYSGIAFLEVFGEKPFSPVPKPEACKAGKEASALYNQLMQRSMILRNSYMPREETSFEIIAFPSPEIEGDFREIFRDTVGVNTLSNQVYRPVQQLS